jgi:murein DD-endopeptidase MepM/ murein hydrolase activator NlpD
LGTVHRAAACLVSLAIILGTGAAAATPAAEGTSEAHALAIEVQAAGQQPALYGIADAPPGASATNGTIIYPADGSVVTANSVAESASAATAPAPSASAGVDVGTLSLFGGEITADAVTARASAGAGTTRAGGNFTGATVTNLVALGQPVAASPNLRVQLGDWGHAVVLEQTVERATTPSASYKGTLVALDVFLDADHGGLAAGSRIEIGVVDASASAPPPAAPTTTAATPTPPPPLPPPPPPPPPSTRTAPAPSSTTAKPSPAAPREVSPSLQGPKVSTKKPTTEKPKATKPKKKKGMPLPSSIHPELGPGLYVFPVYGSAGYGDSFGAARADVAYHHGDDIFAQLGAPVLAVADGTIYSVGWEKLGGNRLWLRDRSGNEFYYAHLAAYTALGRNGARVHAGDVLGFVGNTGDAEGTPYHLHFEVHPVAYLFLGYDGAVDPTLYLDHWHHLSVIRLRPAVSGGPALAAALGPPPGAILLRSTDISTANGLVPGSLEQVLARGAAGGSG